MVISDAEKKVLLERLSKAREVKAAKAAAKKPAALKNETVVQNVEPLPAPEILKEEVKTLPPQLDPPNLLANKLNDETTFALPPKIKKHEKLQEREKIDNSSDESDNEKPVKKSSKSSKKAKQTPYMKIKIFHEPKNHAALLNLIEAVQDNDDETIESAVQETRQQSSASVEAPRLRHDIKNQTPKSSRTLPSHQELMRKAALEFFG
jgi:hypothetical protein